MLLIPEVFVQKLLAAFGLKLAELAQATLAKAPACVSPVNRVSQVWDVRLLLRDPRPCSRLRPPGGVRSTARITAALCDVPSDIRRRHQINLRLSSLVNHRLPEAPGNPKRCFSWVRRGVPAPLAPSDGCFSSRFDVLLGAWLVDKGALSSPVLYLGADSVQVFCPTRL